MYSKRVKDLILTNNCDRQHLGVRSRRASTVVIEQRHENVLSTCQRNDSDSGRLENPGGDPGEQKGKDGMQRLHEVGVLSPGFRDCCSQFRVGQST